MPKKRKTANYIDNKKLEVAIAEHIESPDDKKKKETLINYFLLLAKHINAAYYFKMIDRDDAIQDAAITCFQKADRFKPEKGKKAFNYFTTIILNHFKQLHRQAKSYLALKAAYSEIQRAGRGDVNDH